ncbi:MAG: nucleoside deaminase, partial [Bacteroidales bacterium]|nr:nucleoside deaminase [Bacteroidales bacterium]
MQENDLKYMQEALKEAQKAYAEDEVPIGAVIECGGKIIARAYNYTE